MFDIFCLSDEATWQVVFQIPLLRTGLKEEYQVLIKYAENNKNGDNDWVRLESNKVGARWFGKCWNIHNLLKYQFVLKFDIPVTYSSTSTEILDVKMVKMYRVQKDLFRSDVLHLEGQGCLHLV
uniref:Ubiquitin-fold modifier-conjugating enzyme 1 n=1 Tax=Leptobrachium leishanense TaxID=445787 RepID=A0A8C5MTL1_9ANUR